VIEFLAHNEWVVAARNVATLITVPVVVVWASVWAHRQRTHLHVAISRRELDEQLRRAAATDKQNEMRTDDRTNW
jgi:hypothetical protein